MSAINIAELRKQLEFLTANRDKHRQGWWAGVDYEGSRATLKRTDYEMIEASGDIDGYGEVPVVKEQSVWTCNTSGCLAGWTAMNHGWRPVAELDATVYRDGEFRDVPHVAQEILGLDDTERSELFAGTNSIGGLWRIANRLTNGEIEIPEEFK